jgi:hypothetical protein
VIITKAHFAEDEIVLTPQRWMEYGHDMRVMVERREIVGPNLLGENLVAVEAHYDEEAHRTRVGFAYLPRVRPA